MNFLNSCKVSANFCNLEIFQNSKYTGWSITPGTDRWASVHVGCHIDEDQVRIEVGREPRHLAGQLAVGESTHDGDADFWPTGTRD
jgi:hypothetical protein